MQTCDRLAKTIGSLPGISGVDFVDYDDECRNEAHLYFYVDPKDQRGLFILCRSIDRRYWKHGIEWSVRVGILDEGKYSLPFVYDLKSTSVGEKAQEQMVSMIESIEWHLGNLAFMSGYYLS